MRYKEVEIYQTPGEIKQLRQVVQSIKDVSGDIAEVGVFEGATAQIIREESDKPLYLFDTFCGLPNQLHESDPAYYTVGHCAAPKKHVEKIMKDEKDVYITEGVFPETSGIIKDKKFALVHLDVDIYTATKLGLEFFLPRMNKGGVILVHDYPAHRGVKKAVDEFLIGKELKVELIGVEGRQGIIKI